MLALPPRVINWRDSQQPVQPGKTTQISTAGEGSPGNRFAKETVISGNGQFVVFTSNANDLVAGDNNGTEDVFIYNRQTDRTQLVSVSSHGTQAKFRI